MFENANWIWSRTACGTDSYSEFYGKLTCETDSPAHLYISADSNYAVYLNGVFVDSGQYGDLPSYKVYDTVELPVHAGENHLAIVVWYYGVPSFTYVVGKPGVIFTVTQADQTLLSSDAEILSRKSFRCISGRNERITMQQGLSFHGDLRQDDGWMMGKTEGFEKSVLCSDQPQTLFPRPIQKYDVLPTLKGELAGQGVFTYPTRPMDFGGKMQYAALTFYRALEMGEDITGKHFVKDEGDGIYLIFDLQKECVGYLDFALDVPCNCAMAVGWGEHLHDGRCRTKIGNRNFSATVQLKKGTNRYMNPLRRLGCRYIQLFVQSPDVTVQHVGIRPTVYPLKRKAFSTGNLLRDTIYDTCCHTLISCMHEHYEDCPWREQSLYTLDSRNQMRCGYYAFGEYAFPRAALRLIAKCLRPDGLLPICFPTDEKLTIPSFSLVYPMQLAEYFRHSGDRETVVDCLAVAKTIVDTFISRMEDGLTPNFEGEKYWNFYEWQPHLNGRDNGGKCFDTCLNAMLSLALGYLAELCQTAGEDGERYLNEKKALNQTIGQTMFDPETKLFLLQKDSEEKQFSVLANALCLLCGAGEGLDQSCALLLVKENGGMVGSVSAIPATISMNCFRFDALLAADRAKYREAVLQEIDRVYLKMLRDGATTFWETELGDRDFYYAGSLCHAWSALPIYYYSTLLAEE